MRWQPIRLRSHLASSTEGAACACASARPARQPARRRRRPLAAVAGRAPSPAGHAAPAGRRPRPPRRPTAGTDAVGDGTVSAVVAGSRSRRPLRRQPGRRHDHATSPASTSPPRRRSSTSSSPSSAGYYDDLCLDVELTPSFSTDNYPLVAAGEAQFASGGSFSEVVDFAAANDADLVAVVVEGRYPDRRADPQAGHGDDAADLARRRRSASRARSRPASRRCSPAPASSRAATTRRCCSTASTRSPTSPSTASSASPATSSNEPGTLERAGIAVRPVRPDRLRRPRVVRGDLHDPAFVEEHPTAARGLRAGDDARPRRGDRRPGRRGRRPPST